jgi:osmoprotectant transport system substrate-binding protein
MFKRMWALFAAFAIALGVTACGGGNSTSSGGGSGTTAGTNTQQQPGKGKPAVTMGAKNFTEQFILGELYAQALRAKGWTVNLKSNIGSTEVTDKALTSGKIDFYPEYTGTILSVVKGQTALPRDAQQTYNEAQKFM